MNLTTPLSLDEIRRAGFEAIARDLGPVGLVRFLQMFETGTGDYSARRRQWLVEGDVGDLAEQIRQGRHLGPDPGWSIGGGDATRAEKSPLDP